MKRVAVTGIGIVGPLGHDAPSFFAALARGESAIRRLDGRFHERLAHPIGAAVGFDAGARIDPARRRMMDRVTELALAAAAQALADAPGVRAGLDPARAGAFVGTGTGGAASTDDGYWTLYGERSERLKPFSVLQAMNNAAAAWIALEERWSGPNLTFSTACSSSAVAIGEAARRVACGEADVMLAGGTEAPLNFGTLKAWEALRTLAPEDPSDCGASCKPFARDRSGLVLGEGAAMLVLEERERALARGARIHAEVAGYGLATDALHLTRPSVAGEAHAMRRALDDARMAPEEIGYINAHGTGTPANDGVETAAIKETFGAHAWRIPVSSTKSMHAHLLGAAGALEFAVAILALEQGLVPPTRNLRTPDPECDLDYVTEGARRVPLAAVMSNSFAFGGTNAVLIARAAG